MTSSNVALKICVATACSVAALLVPLYFISSESAVFFIKHWGFWAILGTSLLFLLHLSEPIRGLNRGDITPTLKAHLPGLLVILAATLFLHLHVDRGFKILFDEHTISSTAMNMHFDNRAFVQAASHVLGKDVIASIGFVDKRPIFFPFVLSLVHDLTGYRPENVFWLNSGLTFLLLTLMYSVVARTCGRSHGVLAVLLFAGLPLLAQNTVGGGYEILNLCLICVLILSGIRYLEQPGAKGLNLLILTAILLANTRYESILYVAVPAGLFLLKSYREKRISLTWFSVFSPLLLILPLLSYTVFQGDERFIQTTTDNFFSLRHLPANLAHAATYLFEPGGDYSNSILLSAAGIAALLFLLIQLVRRSSFFLKEDCGLSAAVMVFAVVAVNTTLALSCFWGAWTDPSTSRFSLPVQLFFALGVPMALRYDFRMKRPTWWMPGFCTLFLIAVTGPHAARLNNETRMTASSGYDWALKWAKKNTAGTNDLFVAESIIGFGLHRQAGIPFMVANAMPERVLLMADFGFYDNIYALQAFYYDAAGKPKVPRHSTALNSRYILTPAARQFLSPELFYEISRVEGLRPAQAGGETAQDDLPPEFPANSASPPRFLNFFHDALPLVPKSFEPRAADPVGHGSPDLP